MELPIVAEDGDLDLLSAAGLAVEVLVEEVAEAVALEVLVVLVVEVLAAVEQEAHGKESYESGTEIYDASLAWD